MLNNKKITGTRNWLFSVILLFFIPFPLLMLGLPVKVAGLSCIPTLIFPTWFLCRSFDELYWQKALEEKWIEHYSRKLLGDLTPAESWSRVKPYKVALIVLLVLLKIEILWFGVSRCTFFISLKDEVLRSEILLYYLAIAMYIGCTYGIGRCNAVMEVSRRYNEHFSELKAMERKETEDNNAKENYVNPTLLAVIVALNTEITPHAYIPVSEATSLFESLNIYTAEEIAESEEAATRIVEAMKDRYGVTITAEQLLRISAKIVTEEKERKAAEESSEYRQWNILCHEAKMSNNAKLPATMYEVFCKMGKVSLIDIAESEELTNRFHDELVNSHVKMPTVSLLMKNLRPCAERAAWEELKHKARLKNRPISTSRGEEGENTLQYILHWWASIHKSALIEKDCESQYSDKCIRLANWNLVNEPQEYDHILVTPAGVIHLETKTYSGNIKVTDTDTWEREGKTVQSPASQLNRHHALLRSIVGDGIPVIGAICIADPSATIIGKENSTIPVISIRSIERELNTMLEQGGNVLDEDAIEKVKTAIESSKVRAPKT